MFNISSPQSIPSLVLLENTLLGSILYNLRDDIPREFRMALDRDQVARRIHSLHSTARRRAQRNHVGWVIIYNILVHLLNALFEERKRLAGFSYSMHTAVVIQAAGAKETYNLFPTKELFSLICQVHITNCNFPALIASSDLASQCAADDLVSEADSE